MRKANPTDTQSPDGWRAFMPEELAHTEEMVLLQVASRKIRNKKGQAWHVVPPDELDAVRRSAEAAWSTTLLIPRADLANVEAVISGLRTLGFRDDEVHAVSRALFVTNTDADYATVFQIFDRDHTGGIDPFEFRATMALLGEHSTEGEARELFLAADKDNDGQLDVAEFITLLRRISPKASAAGEARLLRDSLARERLQARIASSSIANVDPASAEAMVQVLVLGGTKAGKTFLLNQVLADKLPKGNSVSVGVGALAVRVGGHDVALQVLDTPGDPRFAPLGHVFYPAVKYALLIYDATSFDSFAALTPLFDAYVAAHPEIEPAEHICLVSNMARLGVKRAISAGYASAWCQQRGGIPFFEVEPAAPQGILEPLHHLADDQLCKAMLAEGQINEPPPDVTDDGLPTMTMSPPGAAGARPARRKGVGFA
jgi:Ras-related protein Rab-7A